MTDDTTTPRPARAMTREERLKAQLKANLGRRKAQRRGRAASDERTETECTERTDD